jgi:drug/metabolite transporter (DMT)-like permease
MKATRISRFNAFLMLVLILFWGSSFVVVKTLLNEGLTPIAIATFRFLLAGILFAITLLLRKASQSHYNLIIHKQDIPTVIALALTGVTLFFTAQYTGINMAGASIAAILVCLISPILITTLSVRLLKEHLTKPQLLGIAIAAIGTLTVITGGTLSVQHGESFFLGSLLLLSTPFLWATYTLTGKRIMQTYDAFLVVAYVNIIGGLFLIPFSFAEGSLHTVLAISLNGWLSILFLSATCSLLGYYIWFHVLNTTNASATSSFLFAEPLVTVTFATMFAGETINPYIVAGGFLIFTGVCLVTTKPADSSPHQKTPEAYADKTR